ncbi:MAG: WG repeat-containing protein [Oscillospiraceae bacterium]|nr:WG repeat-containing protein [Oscillospiraceae bacterium]
MKRLLPLIVLLVMCAMLLVSWSNISATRTEVAEKYKSLMAQGELYEEKRIYIDAVKQYDAALKLRPDYQLALHVSDLYSELKNDKGYINSLDTAITCDPLNPEPYFKIIDFYKDNGEPDKLYRALLRAKEALSASDQMTDEQKKRIRTELQLLLGDITVYHATYESCSGFHRYEGKGSSYIKVCVEGKYGLLDAKMNKYMEPTTEDCGYPNGGLIPIRKNGEYYFIDTAGHRKIVSDKPASVIGSFGGGVAPLQVDGKYGYIDTKMRESHYEYEFAGSFEKGIAPVKQNGKWFVINKQFQPVGPNFDEILVDEYGYCSPYGVYFGKSGNTWGMYSTAGAKIADGFEEVRQFASNQPAAVKKDGKWCFVTLSGEIVLETEYEDADSFSIGYAPVLKNGLWGCIDREGEIIVNPQFKQLSAFNEEGYAIGENAEGLCTVVIRQYN